MIHTLQRVLAMDSSSEPLDTIAAAAAGDMAAFERLYRQFSPRVYGLCLRLTGQREAAEDCGHLTKYEGSTFCKDRFFG